MKKKIFISIFSAAMLVLFLAIVIIMTALWNYYSNQYDMRLRDEAVYIAKGVENAGAEYLQDLSNDEALDGERITWIANNGTVIYDSSADSQSMENHLGREEVQAALKNGSGESQRYSSTLEKKTRYYALRLDDGSVLRSAVTQSTFLALMISALPLLCVLIIAAVVLSLILAARLSRRITEPLNAIDLDEPHKTEVYAELTPLLDKIADQNAQINAQIDELLEQQAVRKEFTANVTHELKTPLTSILGFAEIMKSGIVKPEDMGHFSRKIYDEAQRLLSLIADILRLSKLESDSNMPDKEDIDLKSVAETVAERLGDFAASRGVKLTVSGERAAVHVIPQILDEVIFNIAENAVKYNSAGGSADIMTGYEGSRPFVAVSDTGNGIDAEDLPRIFERFYRADKAHTHAVPGTGLGLSIVKHGVSVMGADITVESKAGRGTVMKVLF